LYGGEGNNFEEGLLYGMGVYIWSSFYNTEMMVSMYLGGEVGLALGEEGFDIDEKEEERFFLWGEKWFVVCAFSIGMTVG
jgi:hypothetical protein